ncbi:MAG: ATP-dependent helicase HrpB [Verrucomicrobiota bacterium]
MSLPVNAKGPEILKGLKEKKRVILMAPTGSGKSTQIPQILVKAGYAKQGKILVLQPRRLAARMLARRVAEEMGLTLGKEVGYQVRFENCTREWTSIVFMTEAILLRTILRNPKLEGISAIVFDEFHERHLEGDVLLAWALYLQVSKGQDVKIVVMSATLDSDRLEKFLQPVQLVQSETRQYDVSIRYEGNAKSGRHTLRSRGREEPIWERAAGVVKRVIREKVDGDILIFMPGGIEIRRTIKCLEGYNFGERVVVLPLHGELPPDKQDEALLPRQQRRIIVSTNVAETSLTIEGVTIVIDSGLARVNRFDPSRGINSLTVEKISQSSAAQRAGRAGRIAPGRCYRLWSRFEQEHLPQTELPEIMRIDLAEILLTLKGFGVEDFKSFPWFEMPSQSLLDQALVVLKDLGALVGETEMLSDEGRRMLSFPLHPRFSRMLLEAERRNCIQGACLAAALLQGRDIFLRKVDRKVQQKRESLFGEISDSDLLLQMHAWNWTKQKGFDRHDCDSIGVHGLSALEVDKSFQQLLNLSKEMNLFPKNNQATRQENISSLLQCFLVAFSDQVACRLDGGSMRCEMVHRRTGEISRNSVVRNSKIVIAVRVRETDSFTAGKGVQTFLEQVSRVDEVWLRELFPNDFAEKNELAFDKQNRRIVVLQGQIFRDLTLHLVKKDALPGVESSGLLAQEIAKGNLVLKHWNYEVEQWILRLNQLAQWCPELELPMINQEDKRLLLEQICEGAISYKQIKERAVMPIVQKWLSQQQLSALQQHAPERIKIHDKRSAKVEYHPEKAPTIRVKIQDLYDAPVNYPIAMDRVKCCVEVLAPNMRPVQISDDLESFWEEGYEKIKLELRRRYPKHEWR